MQATQHETEERLELYALGRLSDSETEEIEEHLFLCDACRSRLDETGTFALTIRDELKTRQPFLAGINWAGWLRPRFVTAGALAVAMLAVSVYWTNGNAPRMAPVASLQLTAIRGDVETVKAARELDLTLTDAPSTGGPFRVEVVDANGSAIWNGVPATGAKGGLQAKVTGARSAGDYFARLYGAGGQLVHEYGFRVR